MTVTEVVEYKTSVSDLDRLIQHTSGPIVSICKHDPGIMIKVYTKVIFYLHKFLSFRRLKL